MNRVCANPECSNQTTRKFCSQRCLYYVRARTESRKLYKSNYDAKNREKRNAYMVRYRRAHSRHKFMEHVRTWWKAVHGPLQIDHIYRWKRAQPKTSKQRRDTKREIRRSVAIKAINLLTPTPAKVESPRDRSRREWRDNNRQWMAEYGRQYRKDNREKVRAWAKIRRRRRKEKAAVALQVLKQMGVEL